MKKISFVILVAMLLSVLIVPASAVETNGTCGENITWTIEDGVLTISGTGSMPDYDSDFLPWGESKEAITKIVLSEGITSVGDYAFCGLTAVTEIVFSPNITTICEWAFANCDSLICITIPKTVTYIQYGAFANCDSLKEIWFPGDRPAFGYEFLRDVTACAYYSPTNATWNIESARPESGGTIKWIAAEAKDHGTIGGNLSWKIEGNTLTISGIGEMNIPYKSMSPWWPSRETITTVIIEEGVTSIGYPGFTGMENITSISLPSTMEVFGSMAFMSCSKLTTINLPEGLKEIGSEAFYWCASLKELTIPKSVTLIYPDAFLGCSSLHKVSVLGSPKIWGAFYAKEVWFYDDAPDGLGLTPEVISTAYYPAGNPTWTADKLQNYGGNVTWVPMCYNGHSFGDWVQVKAPSVEEFGTLRRECTACHTAEEQDIPKLTESDATEPPTTEPAPTQPKPTEPAPTQPVPTEPVPTVPAPTEPTPTQGTTPPTQAPTQEATAPTQPVTVTPSPESNDLWMIYAGVALVVISGGAVAVWVYVIKRRK